MSPPAIWMPLLAVGLAAVSPLCRYTVRDVAFTDLGDDGYRLVAFCGPGEAADTVRRVATAVFDETNVATEVVDPDSDAGRSILGETGFEIAPDAVLIGPENRSLAVSLEDTAVGLTSVAGSPLRDEMLELLLDHYCIVVLAHGADDEQNRAAEAAVQSAFDEVAKIFDRMPKDVGGMPRRM